MIDFPESQTIQRLELWKSSLILVEVLRAAGVDEEQFAGFLTFFEPEDHGILSMASCLSPYYGPLTLEFAPQ